jgi:5-carboxymethyl-2-hydroxymuconate isomerase
MPHLTLEYTANLARPVLAAEVMPPLFAVLAAAAGVDRANCKGRVVRLDAYHVGDGDAARAFVHLDLRLLSGRSHEVRADVGRRALAVLEALLAPTAVGLDLQVTVEVRDLDRGLYFKSTPARAAAEGEATRG